MGYRWSALLSSLPTVFTVADERYDVPSNKSIADAGSSHDPRARGDQLVEGGSC
jgi:hypothetical protein